MCHIHVHVPVHAGERRIRVHSLSVPVSNQLSDIYSKLNVLAITGVLANMGKPLCVGRVFGKGSSLSSLPLPSC